MLRFLLIFLTSTVSAIASSIYCDEVMRQQSNMSLECKLRTYDAVDAVDCMDKLAAHFSYRNLQFAFVGDSRMRQQFHSFVMVTTSVVWLQIVVTTGLRSYFQIMTLCGMESLWEVTWLITTCPSSSHYWTSPSVISGDLWIMAKSRKCLSLGHQIL